jgi:hypothetical protein
VIAVPKQIAHIVAFGFEMGGYLGIEPEISRDWARLLAVDWPVSSAKAEKELDYQSTSLNEAVGKTLDWLKAGSRVTTRSERQGGAAA